ncbi:excisionase family DNA binding protein [Glaciihabitans sp. UYNi722]
MRGKLSTPPFPPALRAHNRGMNDANSPESEVSGTLGRFLTLADTAEILNVSASQAYALVRSGELPAIKIGGHGHWRVERSVLESYIEAKYEEARRMSLWNQSEYASLPEYSFDANRRDQTRSSWT